MENDPSPDLSDRYTYRFGYNISLITALLTLFTFIVAASTPPLSGPFCKSPCFEYPYTDIAARFPRDYLWMYPAIFLSISYLLMITAINHVTSRRKKLFSTISLIFAVMSAMVLLTDYFLQVSVIQPSLLRGETDGIALLSQYNPHGIFIVLEELGFLLMNVSLFCLFPVFKGTGNTGRAIRWTVAAGFTMAIISFILVNITLGINREYIFEVIIITITWTELTVAGFLIALYLKSQTEQ